MWIEYHQPIVLILIKVQWFEYQPINFRNESIAGAKVFWLYESWCERCSSTDWLIIKMSIVRTPFKLSETALQEIDSEMIILPAQRYPDFERYIRRCAVTLAQRDPMRSNCMMFDFLLWLLHCYYSAYVYTYCMRLSVVAVWGETYILYRTLHRAKGPSTAFVRAHGRSTGPPGHRFEAKPPDA